MHIVLKILRGTLRFIVSGLLWITLGVGLAVLAFTSQIADRSTVKSWPDRAGTYENLVDNIPQIIAEQGGDGEETLQEMLDQSGLDQESLFDSINEILPPDFLQSQFESAIDEVYDFFEGETDELAFTIALSERSDQLIDVLKEELITQINNYPECTQEQIAQLVGEEFDPFSANCLPADVNVKKDVTRFIDEFTIGEEGDAIIEDIVIDEDSFVEESQKDPTGDSEDNIIRDMNENADTIQRLFGITQNLQTYFLMAFVVLAFLMVMLASSMMRGLRKLGLMMVGQGFTTAALFWLFPRLSDIAIGTVEGEDGSNEVPEQVMEDLIRPLFETIFGDLGRAGVRFGLLAGFVGAIIWLTIYTWHKIHHHRQDAHAPEEHQEKAQEEPAKAGSSSDNN